MKMSKNDIFSSILLDLPYSKTEDVFLGLILKNNDFYRDTVDAVNVNLFYTSNAIELFLSIKEKIESRPNSKNPATFDSIQKTDDNDFNVYLNVLQRKMVSSTVSFEDYEDTLIELEHYSKIREGLKLTVELQKMLTSKKITRIDKKESFISDYLTNFANIMQEDKTKFPLLTGEDFINTLKNLEKGFDMGSYLQSCFKEIDDKGRIQGGQLIIIAGRPGMGKTSFALNLFDYFSSNSISSLYFSAEMSKEQISKKLTNLIIKKNTEKLTNNDGALKLSEKHWIDINTSVEKMKQNMCFVDKPSLTLMEIKKYVKDRNFQGRILAKKEGKENVEENDLKIVFVDYLQIITSSSSNPMKQEAERIAEITKSLKCMALELKVVIVLLSQINRENTKEKDKRPSMSQLKGSGAIESDADKILLIHREEYYHTKDTTMTPQNKEDIKGIAEVIIDKNRNGETGTIYLNWDGDLQLFNSLRDKKVFDNDGNEYEITAEEQIEKYLNVINGEEQKNQPAKNNDLNYTWGGMENKAKAAPFK